MTTGTTPAQAPPSTVGDMVTDLNIAGGLDAFLNLLDGGRAPLIKYRRGSLTLVSPSYLHERLVEGLDGVVKAICGELGIRYRATASTLFQRRDLDNGIEADKTYYIQHVGALRDLDPGSMEIDLHLYPPPDLAIEVAVTHSAAKALRICAEMSVPEVWVYDQKRGGLTFRHLGEAGSYVSRPASLSFPFLTPTDVLSWLQAATQETDDRWDQQLRAWVREVLGPRRR